MAAFDYQETRRDADQSIRDAGAAYVLVQFGAGDYDPSNAEVGRSNGQHAGAAVRTNYSIKDIDGSYITDKDVKFIVSDILDNGGAMPVAKPGSEILFAGQRFTVQSCKPWNFNGVNVGFVVQGRSTLSG